MTTERCCFDEEWNVKPAGRVWEDLVFNQWWTRDHGHANQQGLFESRAFFGEYDVQVSGSNGENVSSIRHERDGTIHTVIVG